MKLSHVKHPLHNYCPHNIILIHSNTHVHSGYPGDVDKLYSFMSACMSAAACVHLYMYLWWVCMCVTQQYSWTQEHNPSHDRLFNQYSYGTEFEDWHQTIMQDFVDISLNAYLVSGVSLVIYICAILLEANCFICNKLFIIT